MVEVQGGGPFVVLEGHTPAAAYALAGAEGLRRGWLGRIWPRLSGRLLWGAPSIVPVCMTTGVHPRALAPKTDLSGGRSKRFDDLDARGGDGRNRSARVTF